MALVLADRVKETSTTTGTGTLTLAGAAVGFQSFAVIGNGNTCYYTITNQAVPAEWEVGIGTYTSAGTTLARTTILASSNAGAVVTLSAGTKDVFVTYPAGKAIYQDANGAYIPANPVFNGNAVISDNSANAALRITQIGAGNSILVEDSANPDATPFVVDAAGRVGVGTTTVSASNLEAVGTSAAIVTRGSATTSSALVGAVASDYYSGPSFRGAYLQQYSSAATGTTLGFANANLGFLAFQNIATNALIYTNGGTAIVFGTNSADRGRVSSAGVWSLGAAPGAESLRATPVASSVNYLNVQGAVTTAAPSITAAGSDTNINLSINTKGTGATTVFTPTAVGGTATNQQTIFNLQGSAGNTVILRAWLNRHTTGGDWTGSGYRFGQFVDVTEMSYIEFNPVGQTQGLAVQVAAGSPFQVKTTGGEQFRVSNTASAVNYLQVTGSASTTPTLSAQGSGTNVDVVVTPKGTGSTYSPTFAASNGMVLNNATINTSYTLPTGYNALSAGPVTIAAGVTVTVPSGSVWAIV